MAERGRRPPPVPVRTLTDGARRRSGIPRLIAVLAILAAPVGVGAAAVWSFEDGRDGASPSLPLAAGSPPVAAAPTEPRATDAALVDAEPVPAVPLDGVDAFHVQLRKPPRAGLVFDLDTGEVLWRHRPELVGPTASLTEIMTAPLVGERSRA